MKKIICLFLACSFLILACSKDEANKPPCYECTVIPFGSVGGAPDNYKVEKCTNRIDTVAFVDAQGNSLSSQCAPK